MRELCHRDVLERDGGELGGGVRELLSRRVLGDNRRDRVRELQRGELLGGYRREIVHRVRGVLGGGVFGCFRRKQFDCVCAVSGGEVFNRGGGERVLELQRGEVLGYSWRDLVRHVSELLGYVVLERRLELLQL